MAFSIFELDSFNNWTGDFAKENNFTIIKGEYIPTNKNQIVEEHYINLGFKKKENLFSLKVKDYQKKINYIEIKK